MKRFSFMNLSWQSLTYLEGSQFFLEKDINSFSGFGHSWKTLSNVRFSSPDKPLKWFITS
jgi:hypothetical protein